MRKIILAIIISVGLASCNQSNSKERAKILDFGVFTIETPQKWTKIKESGIDSYVGRIAIDSIDTLDFDLGWYSNKLEDELPIIIERGNLKFLDNKADTSSLIIVDNIKDVDLNKYRKTKVVWDTIDGYRTKIVYPIKSGLGITGAYIDSLGNKNRFNLYGTNLKSDNEKDLLKVIKTLKFHKKK